MNVIPQRAGKDSKEEEVHASRDMLLLGLRQPTDFTQHFQVRRESQIAVTVKSNHAEEVLVRKDRVTVFQSKI